MQISDFKNIHKGEKCIVSGLGVSATEIENYPGVKIIGVNDYARLRTPDYLLVVDKPEAFIKERKEFIINAQAPLFTQCSGWGAFRKFVPIQLGNGPVHEFQRNQENGVINHSMTSPYPAVCLAAYMGFTTIALLGVDLTDNHFFANDGTHVLSKSLLTIDDHFGMLRRELANIGVDFVNLSQISRLKSLRKIDSDDFRKI